MLVTSLNLKRPTQATVAIVLLLAAILLPVSASAQAPKVVDDFRTVLIGDISKVVTFTELLANDDNVAGATITVERHALYGQSIVTTDSIHFVPTDAFWTMESDLVVYRVDTTAGSSYGTLYFASENTSFAQLAAFDFEDSNAPLPEGVGLAHDANHSVIGTGSILVQPTSPTTDAYMKFPFRDDESHVGSGETDGCAGGLAEIPSDGTGSVEAAGYLLLLGDEHATVDTAQVRVGVTRGQGDLFIQARIADGSGYNNFTTSDLLSPGNDAVRFRVSFALENDTLIAMLRADGLAVRSPQAVHTEPGPTHVQLGFFQPDGSPGSLPGIFFDDLTISSTNLGHLVGLGMLYDPIQQADDLESGTLGAWTATYGTGVIQDAASFVTGDLGLGIQPSATNGPAFVSYQPPLFGPDDTRFRKLSVRAEFDLASFSIDPARLLRLIEIGSDVHPVFGVTDFELRIVVNTNAASGFALRPAFRRDNGDGTYTWVDGDTVLLDDLSPRLTLQVGRSDSDALDNGWMRLWIEDDVVAELFGLDNDDQPLQTVHLGAKGFSPNANAAGTIRIDDVLIAR